MPPPAISIRNSLAIGGPFIQINSKWQLFRCDPIVFHAFVSLKGSALNRVSFFSRTV
jgi:hypothetical protein